ncbi:unnamed protein product [Microthlaspi erraticum]|uniref:Uncharacterized protein n=1 Tax=Microthlaspi erraticum TaxID=1685480 RepID=A0A6D2IF07_9BRAS|nr:unnamed protein product [Microthlaspi erraticum]
MENDYRVNIVSLEMDRGAAEAEAEASVESTLSNSLESGITVESSRGDADSKLDECAAAAWTNEKHNSYLDYLENSFVKQLYSLLGEEAQRVSTTRDVQSKSHKSTDQFTVLQNGCWQKVNFGKKRVRLETSSEFQSQKSSPRSNPEIPTGHVLCNEEIKNSGAKAFTRTSMRCSLGHEYPAQSSAEASGQNFSGEEEEKGRNSEVCRKRKREANFDDSSLNDQVVP